MSKIPPPDRKFPITLEMVRRLVDTQFPHWAHLPVTPVAQGGWDNRTFHLGPEMTVRMPSAPGYVEQVAKEHRWLPRLAPHLPLPIPVPLAMGQPGEGYPWRWSVYRWLDGETASREGIGDLSGFARDIAAFLVALQAIDATDGPPAGLHNFFRGGPLAVYDQETRRAVESLGDGIDGKAALAVWDAALAATWDSKPVWVHGDIAVGNLLVTGGRLSAVIDFGTSAVGDPACDLVIAWRLFDGDSRTAFRDAIGADSGCWARARGWAIWKALITLANNREEHPAEIASKDVIDAAIAEHRSLARGG